ncbi:MCE family protein [Comamonas testosteroni]|uniref:MCE family protein n=1 Tax=Comamonas testosteroni TaxID=285 RepID=A0A373FF44_COMTE|nr:MlaD family protein [Comamonas testosteroni]RGE42102.1 MCE family protein [Comamonas testosteroni]
MENKSHALAAGIFVLVVAALLAGLAVWLTRDNRQYQLYELSTKDGVSGLQPQATVRYKGVPVGKVVRISFDPQIPGNVLIRIAVGEDTPVTPATYAQLGYQGVTGLAHIQLDDDNKLQDPLKPGPSGLPRLTMKSSPLNMLADQGPVLLERVDEISRRLNNMLGEGNQQRVSEVLDNIAAAAGGVKELTTTLNKAAAGLPQITADAHQTLQSLNRAGNAAAVMATDLQQTVRKVNAPDGPLQQIADGTQSLTQAADALGRTTLPRVNRAAEDFSRASRSLTNMASRIGDNPQSVLYGAGVGQPGPGEPGFAAPAAAR